MELHGQKKFKFQSQSQFVCKVLVGNFIRCGARRRALRIAFSFLLHIRSVYKVYDPVSFLSLFLDNNAPRVFLYAKRIAGITYRIPGPVSRKKAYSIVLHWLFVAARKNRGTSSIINSFLHEFDLACSSSASSYVIKQRNEVHRIAYLNKPFLRYLNFR